MTIPVLECVQLHWKNEITDQKQIAAFGEIKKLI